MRRIDLTSHWDGAGKFLKVSERRREARDIRVRGLSSRHGQTALTGCAVRRSDSGVAESPRDAHLSRGASRRARRKRRLDEGDVASRGRRGEQPRPQYLDAAACARREGGREPLHRDGAGARLSIRRRGDDGRRGTRARHRRGAGRVAGDPCGRAREHWRRERRGGVSHSRWSPPCRLLSCSRSQRPSSGPSAGSSRTATSPFSEPPGPPSPNPQQTTEQYRARRLP